jgi:FkbM family methyltransferase
VNTRRIKILRRKSWLGKLIRLPFKLIPDTAVLPIVSGPLKGCKWIKGSHNISVLIGTYEKSQSNRFFKEAKKAPIFWDLGSHVGYYSMLFAKSNPSGKIFAMEPLERNILLYHENMRLNAIQNYSLFSVAVSDSFGKLSFNTATTSVAGRLTESGDKQVDVIRLSKWIEENKIEVPHLIKMDIEGEEFKVLVDLKEVLLKHKPVLFLSTHGREVHKNCVDLLNTCGYSLKSLDAEDLESAKELMAF